MSSVFVEPSQVVSHTSRINCSRVTTLPASRTRTRSRSNSLAVRTELLRVEPRPPGLRVHSYAGSRHGRLRRSTAKQRADLSESTGNRNGLVT